MICKKAAIAVLLAIAGCGTPPNLHHGITTDYDGFDKALVYESINRHADAWENYFHRELPEGIEIEIVDEDLFDCGGIPSIGCTMSDGTIRVVKSVSNHNSPAFSAYCGLPALFHEFCHRVPASSFYGSDGNHLNPAWASWTEESHRLGRNDE